MHQHLFKNPRLVVAAIKDRIILIFGFINKMVRDQFTGDAFRFMVFIVGGEHLQLYAIAQLGKQAFLEDVRVIGNQDVGCLQDTPGRTVVLLQFDHLQRREILAKQHQVLWPRAAPGVDRLIVIAHHGKARPLPHQQFHQLILAGVGILVFIHQQIANPVLPALPHLFVALQQQRRQQDKVVKVEYIAGFHMRIVQPVAVRKDPIPLSFRASGSL